MVESSTCPEHLVGLGQMMQIGARISPRRRVRALSSSGRASSAWRALARLIAPKRVKAMPWRPLRVGSTQSNMSMPRATACKQIVRRADAHQIARPCRPAAAATVSSTILSITVLRLAHRQPADGVAVEADVDQRPRALLRASPRRRRPARCRTSARPPRTLSKARLLALAPAQRQLHRPLDLLALGRQPQAFVELHGNVGAEQRLDFDGALRRKLAPWRRRDASGR